VIPVVVGIATVVACCLGWAWWRFGSLRDAWLYADGARVVLDRTAVALPTGNVGDVQSAVVQIRNLTTEPVKVLGATVSCDCVETEGLPTVVPAGRSTALRSSIHLDGRLTGPFEQFATYYTDHPAAPALRVVLRGNLRPPRIGGVD
jgi:hypothetical protein